MNLFGWQSKSFLFITLLIINTISGCSISSNALSTPRESKSLTKATPPKRSARTGNEVGQLIHQGRKRTYYLHTPSSYKPNRPMPLVLAFHGSGSQGKDLAAISGFNEMADKKKFIIVYPDGINRRWQVSRNPIFGVNDVSFVSALINHLKQVKAIAPRQIYATGVSNGGFLVQRLACEQSSQIAAFASVVANFSRELQSSCRPKRAISMLMINGTGDDKVPWAGNAWMLSVPDSVNFWVRHNGCNASKVVKQQRNRRVEVARFSTCQGGSEVELVTLKGVGHVWPRGGSGSQQLLNASQEIWDFSQRHPLPK